MVSTAPRIGPEQKPATPETVPSRIERTTEPLRCAADRVVWTPGRSRDRSKPSPTTCSRPKTMMSHPATVMSSSRCEVRSEPRNEAPSPSGTRVTDSPRKNSPPWSSRRARVPTVVAKKAGRSSAPQGLSRASAPPTKAAKRLSSTGSGPGLVQGPLHSTDEDVRRLGAQDRLPGEQERRCGEGTDRRGLVDVALHLGRHLRRPEVRGEALHVQSQLLRRRDQGVLREPAGRELLPAGEQGVVEVEVPVLQSGRVGGAGGGLGLLAEDDDVAELDAEVTGRGVLQHDRAGVSGPGGAKRALVVGVNDEAHRSVDGSDRERVVRLQTGEVDGCGRLRPDDVGGRRRGGRRRVRLAAAGHQDRGHHQPGGDEHDDGGDEPRGAAGGSGRHLVLSGRQRLAGQGSTTTPGSTYYHV